MSRRIYLASSGRNPHYEAVLLLLRAAGHEVYDWTQPEAGNNGLDWSRVDPDWQSWTPASFVAAMEDNPVAACQFAFDKAALDWADTCVCLLPCNRSAHLEAGYSIGLGKPTIFYLKPELFSPELMYYLGHSMVTNDGALLAHLEEISREDQQEPHTTEPKAA